MIQGCSIAHEGYSVLSYVQLDTWQSSWISAGCLPHTGTYVFVITWQAESSFEFLE